MSPELAVPHMLVICLPRNNFIVKTNTAGRSFRLQCTP